MLLVLRPNGSVGGPARPGLGSLVLPLFCGLGQGTFPFGFSGGCCCDRLSRRPACKGRSFRPTAGGCLALPGSLLPWHSGHCLRTLAGHGPFQQALPPGRPHWAVTLILIVRLAGGERGVPIQLKAGLTLPGRVRTPMSPHALPVWGTWSRSEPRVWAWPIYGQKRCAEPSLGLSPLG